MNKLFDSEVIERKLPFNFEERHSNTLLLQSSTLGDAVYLEFFDNVTVNHELMIKKSFQILPISFGDKWQDFIYNSNKYLLKSFLKALFRTKLTKDCVVWVWDLFSTGGFYHWITEICPRLYLAKESGFTNYTFLVPKYFLEKWPVANEIFKIFGVTPHELDSNCVYQIKKFIFISRPGRPFNLNQNLLKQTFHFMKSESLGYFPIPSKYKKIYISRARSGKRIVINEDQVIKSLEEYSYEIHHTEDMLFKDQIELFDSASHVISIHGAALANIAFMKPNSFVVELRHNQKNHMLNCFYNLANTCNLNYGYCFGEVPEGYTNPREMREEDKSIVVDIVMLKSTLFKMHG